jgi:hypothetical protein
VLAFFIIISWLIVSLSQATQSGIDTMLPVVVLFGVIVTRVMQVSSEARRLAMAGFSIADVQKGLTAVVAEREAIREQLRPNVEIQNRRRQTVRWAIGMLGLSAALFYAALQTRVQVGPRNYRIGLGGTTMVITSLVLFGVSLVLLIRSPFRMPVGERLFRRVWLGGFGRWFLRRAARGITPSVTASTGTTGASAITHVATSPAKSSDNGVTIAELDRRIQSLEQWRRLQSAVDGRAVGDSG